MSTLHAALKRIAKLGLILMMGASMNADAGLFGFGGTSWKEEVLLHDGSKIIVERSLKRGGRHEIGQRSGATNETLTFTIPNTNQSLIWEDKLSEDIGSPNFNLLMLEIKDGIAYLVASTMGCLSYNKWGRPNPPYVVFEYQGKEWKRITLQELPAELMLPNLVISSPDDAADKATHGVVTAETIRTLNSTARQPEFKTIVRDAVANYGKRCGDMVYDGNGGWIGIGWFSEQPSKGACLKYCEHQKVGAQYCPCATLFKGAK